MPITSMNMLGIYLDPKRLKLEKCSDRDFFKNLFKYFPI